MELKENFKKLNSSVMLRNFKFLNDKSFNLKIIFKLLLACCLFDRKILKRKNFYKIYGVSFEDLIKNRDKLFDFLKFLDSRFGGDIFKFTADMYNLSDYDLNILYSFFRGYDLSFSQSTFNSAYDFSDISADFICDIYEILKIDEKHGIYRTPIYLVNYIINNNVYDKFKQNNRLRILDPSCGSGIFLVESFKKLVKKDDGKSICKILKKCIYGVDNDEDAVDITVLSIYITLLDYIEDFDNFKFPYLKNKNIFNCDFFDDNIDDLGSFDVIISNPPWYQARGCEKQFEKYAKKHAIPLSNRQIAEAFPQRVCDFLKNDGVASLVLTSKILYNTRDFKFRKYLVNNFNVLEIFDLTLIRRILFKNTSWPCFILTFTMDKTDEFIKHSSLDCDLCKYSKKVKKSCLAKYDWLYKILLVGSIEDFKLIRKLKKQNITLEEFILKHPRLKTGVGFKKSLNKNDMDVSKFLNEDYIKSNDIKKYFLKPSDKWQYRYAGSGDVSLVKSPFVVMKSTFTTSFDFIAAYSNSDVVFDHNTFAIKGDFCDEIILKNIMALINSDLFKYFFFMTGGVGVEKNRTPFGERMKFPISKNLINNMDLYDLVCLRENNDDYAEKYDDEINMIIFKAYNLSEDEITLVKNIK